MEKNVTKTKLALAQINLIPADIEYNKNKIIQNIKTAMSQEVGLVMFPNLALYGYCKYNLLKKYPYVVSQIQDALEEIKKLNFDIDILIGYPEIKNGRVSDEFALISKGEIKKVSTFEFDKKIFKIISKTNVENNVFSPTADCLICSFTSISRTNMEYYRNKALSGLAKFQNKKCIFINQVGAIDELIYDGSSRMYNEKGEIMAQAKSFEEDLLIIDFEMGGKIEKTPVEYSKTTNLNEFSLNYENDLERTYRAIILAIKDYFSKNGFKQAVLGLSGGLDSTICAVLLADALGPKNVLGVSMPSKLSSSHSKTDAYELAKNLGINYIVAPIEKYHDLFSSNLEGIFKEASANWCNRYTSSFTQDNIQARSRAMILWAIANEFGATLPVATSDKSETYMGYATINGDMSGGYAPILDVTKTKLFALARWMNENRAVKNAIPESVILKPPGAELAIDPKTGETLKAEDALMPYEFLDEVIWRIENFNQSIDNMMQNEFIYEKKNILDSATKKAWLEKFFRRLNTSTYKWYISAPSPIIDAHSINKIEYAQPIASNINHSK
ncbi:MAG: NAD(+) synthase [Candidatus Gastranaerophilales bacterium]|nr:NAD(+) synthase [Candidatus Gastranaerophilales bacterium]